MNQHSFDGFSLSRGGLLLGTLLLAGIFSPQSASAQGVGQVSGRVTDSRTSAPIRDIYIRVLETRTTSVTGSDGQYLLSALSPGTYTIRFSWLGYRDRDVPVQVQAGTRQELNVVLEADPISLGEISVTTVSRQPEPVVESPAAVATVAPGRIRDLAASGQVPLLLADLPGVHVMQSGVNSFNVNPRSFNGLVNRRMLVLVDGRDVGAAFVGAPEWPALSVLEGGARVELIRGPGSAMYGANAFSGVLNIVTPSVRQAQGTRLTLGGGDRSSFTVDGRHAFVSEDLRWGFRLSGGYSEAGTVDRSRTNLGDLADEYSDAGDAGLEGEPPQPGFEVVPLVGQVKAAPFGVPGAVTGDPDPMTTVRGEVRVDRYLEGGGTISAEGGFTRIQNQVNASGASRAQILQSDVPWARMSWQTDAFSILGYYSGRTGEQVDLSSGRDFEDSSSRLHVEAQTNRDFAGDRGRVVLGGSLRRGTVDSKGTVLAPEHDGRTDEYYALFGQVDFRLLDDVEFVLVGRYDESSLFEAEVAPRAALVWTPLVDQHLRVAYGRAYLMPSPTQRFVRFPLGPPADLSLLEAGLRASPLGGVLLGVPDGTLLTNSAAVPALTIGDETLGPEGVTTLEFGYKGQFERVFLTADLHISEFEDFFTDLLPGVHPLYGPWTAPDMVPEAVRGPVEDAVREAVPGITRLQDGTTAIVYAQTNAGRASQWGVELSAGFQATEELRFDGNYSYVTVEFEEETFPGGNTLPTNTPSHVGNLSVTYARPQGTRVRLGLSLMEGFDFQSGVWQGAVPSRQTLDLSARHKLTSDLSAGISVTNLLDQNRYHYFGGSIVGRRLMASLTWEP